MSNSFAEFKSRFRFDRDRKLFIGVERERFLIRDGKFVPESVAVMRMIAEWYPELKEQFTYEFSACVIENRTRPCGSVDEVRGELQRHEEVLADIFERLGLQFSFKEVAPTTIPFVINEHENERYRKLLESLELPAALAACRIIGTHVHIGMPDHESALRAYNRLVRYWQPFALIASSSGDRRLKLYRTVRAGYLPLRYLSWHDFYEDAREKGFAENPKDNWAMVRLTAYGTIETKAFGATDSLESVCDWAGICQWLCATEISEEDVLMSRLHRRLGRKTFGED